MRRVTPYAKSERQHSHESARGTDRGEWTDNSVAVPKTGEAHLWDAPSSTLVVTRPNVVATLPVLSSPSISDINTLFPQADLGTDLYLFRGARFPLDAVARGCPIEASVSHTMRASGSTQYQRRALPEMSYCH